MTAYMDTALFVKSFVSYDARQRKAAELSGLRVLPAKAK